MEQYKVEITKEALQDMEDIYNYIFYTIRADKVIVTDVLYTASDIEARLHGV